MDHGFDRPTGLGPEHGLDRDLESEKTAIRLVLVDDHALFRAGLASLLASRPGIDVVGQASGGLGALRLADELRPDVVLIDLRLADMDGAEAIRAIVDTHPSTRVIVMTVLSEDRDVESAVHAGACGFLAKDTPVQEVVSAVHAAAHGAAWLSPRAAEVLLGRLRQAGPEPDRALLEQLSPRELDVLRLIARGMENAEIATALQISPRTAKNHVSSVLGKLGMSSRVQAAVYAVRRGLE